MKKFFFFRSSGSSSENKNLSPKSLTDKDVYWEQPSESGLNNHVGNSFHSPKGLFSKSRKQSTEHQSPLTNSGLRKSRSLSSAAFQESGLDRDFSCSSDRSRSPFTRSSNTPTRKIDHFSRKPKTKQTESEAFETANRSDRPSFSTSHASHQELSGNSSLSSSNLSSKVVDRYIDGEQEERTFDNDLSRKIHGGQGQEKSRRPPRAQYTAPYSPGGIFSEKPKSHSFRDVRGAHQNFSARDWAETGYGYESPRKLAKNVIERLSQCSALPKTSPKDGLNSPVTLEDIYSGTLNKPISQTRQNLSSLDVTSKTSRGYDVNGLSSFHRKKLSVSDSGGDLDSVVKEDEADVELQSALKEANERAMSLSEEFEQQRFICDSGVDVMALIQETKSLAEEKMRLAFEVSAILQSHIADRANAKEELRHLKTELCDQTRRLEREKNEIQSSLEKELDRRSNDWSLKLEKYKSEEYRLRERVRELAEQNVALQRELSAMTEKEIENRNSMTHSELQLKDQAMRFDALKAQNQELRDNLVQLQEQYKAAAEDRDCFCRNYEEKESECKDLHKSITRLMRTTGEQEKTISELTESLIKKVEGEPFPEKFDKPMKKLQAEQIRLTGVEQALRKEVEAYKREAESLRHENIELINRLKGVGKEGCSFTFKLDKEMWTRIQCLENQGLALLNDSTLLCSKLQGILKGKAHTTHDAQKAVDSIRNGLDRQFMIECDVKIQGFRRGIESLTRSLQTISFLLDEKGNSAALDLQSNFTKDDPQYRTMPTSERILKSELKAETLLTNLLREKLHCKELEVEQLQAELSTSVRGNDILKCEVQNALDSLSCASHTMKELELQNLKKDDNINQIRNDLQECTKELTIMKGILPKVSDERDVMWEEVKQYSEKNMLLNSEINALKKKLEALDEDVLLKEGQISILKDSLCRKPFDLLGSPNSCREFVLD
uniref:DUF7653 domain-containing protein n=1 Tax=Kalanchoe fedtschenkoi TaxID=63787 RepID=A0A7N0UCD4_KALFE